MYEVLELYNKVIKVSLKLKIYVNIISRTTRCVAFSSRVNYIVNNIVLFSVEIIKVLWPVLCLSD